MMRALLLTGLLTTLTLIGSAPTATAANPVTCYLLRGPPIEADCVISAPPAPPTHCHVTQGSTAYCRVGNALVGCNLQWQPICRIQ
jgi:hypothetical protein